jgi:hypothetical protein
MQELERAPSAAKALVVTKTRLARAQASNAAKTANSPVQRLLPVLVAALGGFVGYLLFITTGHDSCAFTQDYLPDLTLYVLGVVAFYGGHYLGEVGAPAPKAAVMDSVEARKLGRYAMASAFAIASLILVFEAYGTAETPAAVGKLEPITYYIRCAVYHDISGPFHGLVTIAVVILTFFLAGHWLWGARPAR